MCFGSIKKEKVFFELPPLPDHNYLSLASSIPILAVIKFISYQILDVMILTFINYHFQLIIPDILSFFIPQLTIIMYWI